MQMAGRPLGGLTRVDAYNLSYLRDGATAAIVSGDEYDAPLLSFWQRGAGRAAAVTFPMGGEHSQTLRAWTAYGDFTQTIARWLAAADVPPGVSLHPRLSGQELRLALRQSAEAEQRGAGDLPTVHVVEGNGAARELTWERIAPGRLEARVTLEPGHVYRGAVQMRGGATLPFGPIEVPGGAEWAVDRTRIQELLSVVRRSGGEEIVNLAGAWKHPRVRRSSRDLRPPLLWLFLGLFLAEALRTRIAGSYPRVRDAATTVASTPVPATGMPARRKEETPAGVTDDAGPEPVADPLAEALRRAKRR
jgi:hypothetical protein